MKKTNGNIEHRIQLKKDEIERYKRCIVNYDTRTMERCGIPYLAKLQQDLDEILKEK
jgi:hypothetical protein